MRSAWKSDDVIRARLRRAQAFLVALAICHSNPTAGNERTEATLTRILQSHTREVSDTAGTRVDYRGLQTHSPWAKLVASLEDSAPGRSAGRDEKLAFWINVYNILAIETVVRSYPVASIRDVGSLLWPVWRREAGRVAGAARSLHEIEHRILRPMGEPRIHAAIVCASVSCPPLHREAFSADRLDAQLNQILKRWLSDPRKGFLLDRSNEIVHLSSVFDWFEEDFASHGGVLPFLLPHLSAEDRKWLESHRNDLSIEYLDYDWSLNDLGKGTQE